MLIEPLEARERLIKIGDYTAEDAPTKEGDQRQKASKVGTVTGRLRSPPRYQCDQRQKASKVGTVCRAFVSRYFFIVINARRHQR